MTGTDLRRHIDKGIPVLYNGEIFTPIGFTYIRNKHETICSAWLQTTDGTHRFTVDFDDILPEDELTGIDRIGKPPQSPPATAVSAVASVGASQLS